MTAREQVAADIIIRVMCGDRADFNDRTLADEAAAVVVAALDAQPGDEWHYDWCTGICGGSCGRSKANLAQPGDAERAGSGWHCDGCDGETTGKCAAIANPEDCSARAAGPADDTAERALAEVEVRHVWAIRWPDGAVSAGTYSGDGSDYAEQMVRKAGAGEDIVHRTETITRTPWLSADTAHPADSFNRTEPIDEGEL